MSSLSLILFSVLMSLSTFLFHNNLLIFLYFPLFSLNSMEINMSFLLDWSATLFAASVMLISSMIIIYSSSYIPINEHKRFSMILLSFIASMIMLIFSNNVFFMMIGWDGLGISSYILVVYYQNFKSLESGAITIISNRIGDITIILSIGILTTLGSWDMFTSKKFPLLILILLILAAMTKSAQIPFSAWLPAAMAAPTPISALVHSSTLVTAGVYMMTRILYSLHPFSMMIILVSSSLTMFFSGMSANWEQDLKKIIALSTLSQIAMMMFAISINSINTAFFHLITHAFFKSTMFLCAGVMIHGSSYQDMRSHGSSTNNTPILMTSLGMTNMALMGLPFMAGFFSKDAIMETFLANAMNTFMILIMFFSLGLTASYSTRMVFFSSNMLIKSKKDKYFHMDNMMSSSIMILSPMSVFMGSLLMWFSIPFQTIILTMHMKISITLMITMGLINGLSISFKSKYMNTLGESSISLWFLHMLSCNTLLKSLSMSFVSWLLDKTWFEILGPQGQHSTLSDLSKHPDMLTSLSLFMLGMFCILPSLIMYKH